MFAEGKKVIIKGPYPKLVSSKEQCLPNSVLMTFT